MQNFSIKLGATGISLLAGLISLCLFGLWAGNPVFAAQMPRNEAQPAQVAGETIYVIQHGDTLYSLARRFGTTVDALMKLNNISNSNQIYVGQRLRVPGSATPATPTPPSATPTPDSTNVWTAPTNAIEIFSPVQAGIYHSPIEVNGFSQTFEGNVNLRLKDAQGIILAQRNATGGASSGFAFFHTYLRFAVATPIAATLDIFESSAKDGSEIHKVSIPLTLQPGQRVIDIDSPAVGAQVCNPLVIGGYSNTFEGTVNMALRQRDKTALAQGSAQGGNLGIYANFTASFNNPVSAPQPRLVSVYENDAAGRGFIDQTVVPVTLYPKGRSQCP